MNDVLSDLLGKLVEVQLREFTPKRGEVRAVSANANGYQLIVHTDDSMLIGYNLHECRVTLLYKCPSCSSFLPAFPTHERKQHDEKYHPPRCRARWRAGVAPPVGTPPDGARCTRPEGHEGDHAFHGPDPRNAIHEED